jgi:hypothetical protein
MNRFLFKVSAVLLVAALSGCGGGGGGDEASTTDPTTFPATYLAKYQGTRYQKCVTPIQYGASTFGPSSVRERIVVSAPDAAGQVSMSLIEDFFASTLSCYDYTSTPYASVQTSVPATGKMLRVEALALGAINLAQDVVLLTQQASPVIATGSGIAQVDVNGTVNWRITFPDGRYVDRPLIESAGAGEVALYLITVNGVSGAELALNGDMYNSFARP